MKKLLAFVLCFGFLVPGLVFAENTKEEINSVSLHGLIGSLGSRLYNTAEVYGSGKNGENYQKIIDESVQKVKAALQNKNVSVNARDEYDETPLMDAAWNHQWEVIELLLQAGADKDLVDKKGSTAYDHFRFRRKSLTQGMMGSIIYYVMRGYWTKDRHNKCVDLLASTWKQRFSHKRWI